MVLKSVKIFFRNSCTSLFQLQNIYRMNKRRCPSVLYTIEESTRFAGASINLSGRHANNSHGAKLTTQFVTSRICSLWRWFWRKYKREFYLQTSALIFSKIALRTDIRAQNDLCVDQLETSTSYCGLLWSLCINMPTHISVGSHRTTVYY